MRLAVPLALVLAAGCGASHGADRLLHPQRKAIEAAPRLAHRELAFAGERGATLRGWLFPAGGRGPSRGLVVYLHGMGDNRASGLGLAERYVARGFDVLLYDARAHGRSGGAACTYGALERRDLARALDAAGADRAVLLGVSLGAAVAIQAAADEPRVAGVVAVAAFSTLEAIAREWAGATPDATVRSAIALAEAEAGFRASEASPAAAAPRVRAPVLLVHGDRDRTVGPHHAHRLYALLGGPRRLLLVPGAGHDDALGRASAEVDAWIEAALPARGAAPGRVAGVRGPR